MPTVKTAKPIYSAELYVESCYRCGIAFGIPKEFQRYCEREKTTFYCPNGHGQSYISSTEELLRREIEKKERSLRYAQDDIAYWRKQAAQIQGSLNATKGHLTRARQRAAAGVCQECHRTFRDVARHNHTKHGPTHDQSVCRICKGIEK